MTGRALHRSTLVGFACLLLLLFGGMEFFLLRAYKNSREVTRVFQDAADTITSIANAQAELLRLRAQLQTLDKPGELDQVELRLGLAERQLQVTAAQTRSLDTAIVAKEALRRVQRAYPLLEQARRNGAARHRDQMLKLVAPLDQALKVRFDAEEHTLYAVLASELGQRRSRQLLLIILGGLVLVVALVLTLIVRRTLRSSLARANQALRREMDERRALQEKLYEQATHDSLTGLSNRLHFQHQLNEALCAEREVAVVFIDLDGFKYINDAYGHDAGDGALRAAAQRLQGSLRAGDQVARLGGDEFAILLQGDDTSSRAQALGNRLNELLSEPLNWHGHRMQLAASVGIAVSGEGGTAADELLRNADLAMYAVKRDGKGRVGTFTPGMREEVSRRRRLEADLAGALAREEMVLHYQPIVDPQTQRTLGIEALIRWQHPADGLLPPGAFLDLAESTGLIVPIGNWVIREACAQAARWREQWGADTPWVSVNLSPRQLRHPGLVHEVRSALEAYELPAGSLMLEISESIVVQDARAVVGTLEQLRSLGCGIALDDFGAGQASLGYLRFLPLDLLKIDRSLVSSIGQDSGSRELAKAVLRLAESVGLTAVAEGVESELHERTLTGLGFPMAQGFFYSRPGPAGDLVTDLPEQAQVA